MRYFKENTGRAIKGMMLAGTAGAALVGVTPVAAQDTEVDENAANSGPVIIVTARSRAEDIQDVPLAITAFSEEDIERQSLQDLNDVSRFTPGFSFEDFSGGFAQPVIRGLATTRVTALESNVSTFFDGVYIPRSWAVDVGTASLQRVEVVKGPQSARYGRNAFAGAINYIPRKADIDAGLSGMIEGTLGSDERYDGGGFVNASFGDLVAIAGSYQYSEFDGSWENAHPFADVEIEGPSTQGNVGGWQNEAYSISGQFEPTPGFVVEAGYFVFDVENEARASRYIGDVLFPAGTIIGGILDPGSISATDNGLREITNCGTPRGNGLPLICGELPGPADSVVVDPRSFATQAKTKIFRAGVELEPTDNVTINYVFANVDGDVLIGTSGEPDPINCGTLVPGLCNFQQTPVGGIDYDTHEARVTYDNGNIRAAVGGFISDGVDRNVFTTLNILPITDPGNVPPLEGGTLPRFDLILSNERTETEVQSIFGEFYWTSGDGRLTIGAEGRYSETEITGMDLRRSITLQDTFKEFTPRFTVDYDLNPDVMLFATVGRGAKAGGFNPTSQRIEDRVFDPEYNWTYELGLKSSLAGGRLNFNASVFYTDWTNIQVNAADTDPANPNPNTPTITQNLGNAELYGIELSARFQATDNLSFDATFSHTEGEYSEGTVDSRFSRGSNFAYAAPCDNIVCDRSGDISGNEIERAAPTQASGGIQWDSEFGVDNSYYIRADASWQSDFFSESANVGIIPERFLVNASAGVSVDRFNVRVWARNLFDRKYVSNAFVVLLPFGNTYGEFFGERRTYGVTASVDF